MGFIKEPKNVDLVVGPSVFTEDTQHEISQAIAEYKKTGQKPNSVPLSVQGAFRTATNIHKGIDTDFAVRVKAKL